MIPTLRDMPIRRKLILMMMISSCTVIVLVAVAHDLVRAQQSRQDMVSELSAMAAVVAFNSRAAVAFNDAEAATKTLSALQFEPAILSAVLLVSESQPLAAFRRKDQSQGVASQNFGSSLAWQEPLEQLPQQRFYDGHFFHYQPVILNGELVGKLFLKSELSSLRERILLIVAVSLVSLLIASIIAYLLALRLQRWISEPLQQLTGAMEQVSGEKTLNVRMTGQGHDEIGMLLEGFNSMVARIEDHEKQLADVNEGLEHTVELRTAELLQTNLDLTSEIDRRERIEQQQHALLVEKELLLKEVHHRVKNNLQVISSLINMQMRKITADEGRAELFSVRERIRSMALIHQQLCRTGDLSEVDFAHFAHEFIKELTEVYGIKDQAISLQEEFAPVTLNVDQAVPCGMILNELLGNVFKHAFSNQDSGEVIVSLSQINNQMSLVVEDNGRGGIKLDSPSLGLKLIHSLVDQLNGKIAFTDSDGSRVEVAFPNRNAKNTRMVPESEQGLNFEKAEG